MTEKKIGFKLKLHSIVMSIRLPNQNEAQMSEGKLRSDLILVKNNFAVGQFSMPAVKPLKIGKKFEVMLYFKELSEEDYKSLVTEGLIEVGDKNMDVGII